MNIKLKNKNKNNYNMYDYDSKDILYVWSKTIYTVNFNLQIVRYRFTVLSKAF